MEKTILGDVEWNVCDFPTSTSVKQRRYDGLANYRLNRMVFRRRNCSIYLRMPLPNKMNDDIYWIYKPSNKCTVGAILKTIYNAYNEHMCKEDAENFVYKVGDYMRPDETHPRYSDCMRVFGFRHMTHNGYIGTTPVYDVVLE